MFQTVRRCRGHAEVGGGLLAKAFSSTDRPPGTNKSDPYAPRPKDGPGVAAWRRRMRSPHGKGVYKRRAMGECINARFRQWGLRQFTVRGVHKVKTVLLWFALANNIIAGHRLKTAKA